MLGRIGLCGHFPENAIAETGEDGINDINLYISNNGRVDDFGLG